MDLPRQRGALDKQRERTEWADGGSPPVGTHEPADPVATLIEHFGVCHRLSQREQQVLALGASGLLLKEAAHELGCSQRTVEEYWQRIFTKVRVRTKVEILARLLRLATTGPLATQKDRPDGDRP
jgi:DNA-binding NarL/FixJ family response regulator